MSRYIADGAPVAGWWEADAKNSLARTVHEQEPQRVDTGLLNADGVRLYRVADTQPIGFVVHRASSE